jgi:hypothetical protein
LCYRVIYVILFASKKIIASIVLARDSKLRGKQVGILRGPRRCNGRAEVIYVTEISLGKTTKAMRPKPEDLL